MSDVHELFPPSVQNYAVSYLLFFCFFVFKIPTLETVYCYIVLNRCAAISSIMSSSHPLIVIFLADQMLFFFSQLV